MEKKLIQKILSGLSDKNIRFEDLRKLLLSLDFEQRTKGDHYIFIRNNMEEIINLQPLRDGKAKAYQVKQVRNIILKYKIHRED